MKETLLFLLRIAGLGLLCLAAVHVPISKHLKWREETQRLSAANSAVFHVHVFFICVVLVLMGLPCLLEPEVFLERTRASTWLAWSFAGFWAIRLYAQWFIFPAELWRGRRLETTIHYGFTGLWLALTATFAACGLWQRGWFE